ncbi:MAG: IPT/TIG domain-containing protein [Myxococcota bacterium]
MLRRIALLALALGCDDTAAPSRNPRIERLVPEAAPPGARVEILGANFGGAGAPDAGPDAGDRSHFVAFGGVSARTDLWRHDRIAAEVPACARGETVVVVTVSGRPSDAVAFEALPAEPSDGGGGAGADARAACRESGSM